MRRFFVVIFSFFIALLFLTGNLCACLEVDINILKETCKNLFNQLIEYDAELAPLNQELCEFQIEAESAKQECVSLMADHNVLTAAGDVLARVISALTMQLTELRRLPLPWDILTGNTIEDLARQINEKTLQLNVFRAEILKLTDKINALKLKIISLENSQRVLESKITDLQIRIKYDEQSLKEAELSLSSKLERISIVEQNIKQTNTQAQIYSNGINLLLNRIAALSASQQGSGGVIPEGLEELQRAIQEQRALLLGALNRLEALHFEHGC